MSAIGEGIHLSLNAAQAGCVGPAGEVDRLVYFFLEGLPAIEAQFNLILGHHGIRATLSGIFCHQTPRVEPNPQMSNHPKSCELGDIMFLSTYGRRLYGRFLGNAMMVQAKEEIETVHGTLQDELYRSATHFTYRSPFTLAGQARDLAEARNALWYWGFHAWHSFHEWRPEHWRTIGERARNVPVPFPRVPFESALMDLICGINGRRAAVLEVGSPQIGWSKIVDDIIRTTARSAFRRQNAFVSRNREPLRGEDAIRAVNAAYGQPAPFLIRSSFGRLMKIFDEEISKHGMELERLSQEFDPENYHDSRHQNTGDHDGIKGPPSLGSERGLSGDDGGGCSFVIMDFSVG